MKKLIYMCIIVLLCLFGDVCLAEENCNPDYNKIITGVPYCKDAGTQSITTMQPDKIYNAQDYKHDTNLNKLPNVNVYTPYYPPGSTSGSNMPPIQQSAPNYNYGYNSNPYQQNVPNNNYGYNSNPYQQNVPNNNYGYNSNPYQQNVPNNNYGYNSNPYQQNVPNNYGYQANQPYADNYYNQNYIDPNYSQNNYQYVPNTLRDSLPLLIPNTGNSTVDSIIDQVLTPQTQY